MPVNAEQTAAFAALAKSFTSSFEAREQLVNALREHLDVTPRDSFWMSDDGIDDVLGPVVIYALARDAYDGNGGGIAKGVATDSFFRATYERTADGYTFGEPVAVRRRTDYVRDSGSDECCDAAEDEDEVPAWLATALAMASKLTKGAGHRYIRRVPKSGGGYRYFYKVSGGAGLGHADEMKVGSKFRVTNGGQDGHFEILGKNENGTLRIKHDESGHESTISPIALRSMLRAEHAQSLTAHREKLAADIKAADDPKAKARLLAEAGKYEHTRDLAGGESEADERARISAKGRENRERLGLDPAYTKLHNWSFDQSSHSSRVTGTAARTMNVGDREYQLVPQPRPGKPPGFVANVSMPGAAGSLDAKGNMTAEAPHVFDTAAEAHAAVVKHEAAQGAKLGSGLNEPRKGAVKAAEHEAQRAAHMKAAESLSGATIGSPDHKASVEHRDAARLHAAAAREWNGPYSAGTPEAASAKANAATKAITSPTPEKRGAKAKERDRSAAQAAGADAPKPAAEPGKPAASPHVRFTSGPAPEGFRSASVMVGAAHDQKRPAKVIGQYAVVDEHNPGRTGGRPGPWRIYHIPSGQYLPGPDGGTLGLWGNTPDKPYSNAEAVEMARHLHANAPSAGIDDAGRMEMGMAHKGFFDTKRAAEKKQGETAAAAAKVAEAVRAKRSQGDNRIETVNEAAQAMKATHGIRPVRIAGSASNGYRVEDWRNGLAADGSKGGPSGAAVTHHDTYKDAEDHALRIMREVKSTGTRKSMSTVTDPERDLAKSLAASHRAAAEAQPDAGAKDAHEAAAQACDAAATADSTGDFRRALGAAGRIGGLVKAWSGIPPGQRPPFADFRKSMEQPTSARLGDLGFRPSNGNGDAMGHMPAVVAGSRPAVETPASIAPEPTTYSAQRGAVNGLRKSMGAFYGQLAAGASQARLDVRFPAEAAQPAGGR